MLITVSHFAFTASAIVCLVGSVVFLLSPTSFQLYTPLSAGSSFEHEPFSLAALYESIPYTSSWRSWWHPERGGRSSIEKGWNLLYHLGGNGPWIEKVDGIVDGGIGVPEGMLDLLKRIKESRQKLEGDLEFANDWEYFTQDPDNHLEQLTTTGPFAGTLEAFTTGVKLRTRYNHLLGSSGTEKIRLWASDSDRVTDTARYFSAGLFGLDWEHAAELVVIPETDDLGADTLTPTDTCTAYLNDLTLGHDYGSHMLERFRSTYLGAIADRLEEQNPHIRFNDSEIYSMQEMCGFETTVRGSSKWCEVFTHADWLNFEPGNPWGPVMGWLWLNATTNLLTQGPTAGPLFFSFVHDSDIVAMVAALGIFTDSEKLPIDRVPDKRRWRTSQMTPMGGRVIFERLACSHPRASSDDDDDDDDAEQQLYVRVNVNDGIVEIPHCGSGPGSSCPLERFVALVAQRGAEAGDFREKCNLSKDSPDRITFLHQ
ncbi:hypothetical protein GP486_006372 [Trichoglossum hirsutum]|uniref:Phosphoglycerate mutase-like protein n=1 Tax=Trichoglossum hirsutum TaxID=265104 RepID=A0A9P8IIQ5_9PEZI|nr:hypothetical protein GP486_006372 [Trichoglossum hirsutum]